MGLYLNHGNIEFSQAEHSAIYVDKTDMIAYLNTLVNTEGRYVCVSRPRRFGKSITANMIAAYYEKGCDSTSLFADYKLGKCPDWDVHMNRYDTIRIDMAELRASMGTPEKALEELRIRVCRELENEYPEILTEQVSAISYALATINEKTGVQFVIIIDEWDCFFRDTKYNGETYDEKVKEEYIDLLRSLFKGNQSKKFLALAYITGILPIKRYNSESALNNFDEYTVLNPGVLADMIGFTEDEVKSLCETYEMDFEMMKKWYDGYRFFRSNHIYNPNSVVKAIRFKKFQSYWTDTASYDSLRLFISMNFEGLKDDVVSLLGGQRERVNLLSFQNDLTKLESRNDVLTLLIHLGYLVYDPEEEKVFIPNKEVLTGFGESMRGNEWKNVAEAIEASEELLYATLDGDEETVARMIDECHEKNTSLLRYNNENALAAVVNIAYFTARKYYNIIREFPTGRGFADVVFLPDCGVDKPPMVVELKWNQNAKTAIKQIKEKKYTASMEGYRGKILLVGINYDKETKKHECVIEKWKMK